MIADITLRGPNIAVAYGMVEHASGLQMSPPLPL